MKGESKSTKALATMAKLPILYSFRRCPYAMRARMAIAQSGVSIEHREILLKNKPAEMLAVSPKGTVPVLVLPDERVLDESLVIMDWALKQHDPGNWLRNRHDASCQSLVAKNDNEFKPNLDRYKYPTRYENADPEQAWTSALNFLQTLDKRLTDQSFLDDDKPGWTDAAIFPFIRQFANVNLERFSETGLTHLEQWRQTWSAHEDFLRVMNKVPLWKSPSDQGPIN